MPIELLVGMAASIILSTVKNAGHKVALKSVMLKIYTTIKNAYAGDQDFK